jgi:hypothetical protein
MQAGYLWLVAIHSVLDSLDYYHCTHALCTRPCTVCTVSDDHGDSDACAWWTMVSLISSVSVLTLMTATVMCRMTMIWQCIMMHYDVFYDSMVRCLIFRSYMADIASRNARDTWIRKLVVTKESKLYGKVNWQNNIFVSEIFNISQKLYITFIEGRKTQKHF